MNFIKKIVDGDIDEGVHLQFQKFSKGVFRNRAVINAKNSKGKYTITTTAEFSNEIVKAIAEKLGENKTKITGAIVSTNDLKGQIEFKEIKQFQGVKRYIIEKEMSGTEILGLLKEFPKAFFALSFEVGNTKLKIKPKAPKSGKPSSKGEGASKPNFCKLITNDEKIGKSFVFEKPDFKEAEITHTFFIEELIIPGGEKDYSKIREMAKRKGKIIREAKIDGQYIKREIEFCA